mmetsp:Transcript_535/g.874  ORF Transcript_535/g.874 Transcript_535/m.874 type:complete len:266 (-) Transcript_535:35-832(-)
MPSHIMELVGRRAIEEQQHKRGSKILNESFQGQGPDNTKADFRWKDKTIIHSTVPDTDQDDGDTHPINQDGSEETDHGPDPIPPVTNNVADKNDGIPPESFQPNSDDIDDSDDESLRDPDHNATTSDQHPDDSINPESISSNADDSIDADPQDTLMVDDLSILEEDSQDEIISVNEDVNESPRQPPPRTTNRVLCPQGPVDLSHIYNKEDFQFTTAFTQMSAKKGLRIHGRRAEESIIGELTQLEERGAYHPVSGPIYLKRRDRK